ncbi:hypothetical protein [Klebsiella pneumoniae]|uniref:hypothetical protein n=1 Tax=Klebsiella pneumoniae TaxID=573 RepID=UPI001D0D0CB9|nr:hypothetical protein [Klebsiella pneumoniae]
MDNRSIAIWFSASQCTWSVSNAENPHGWKPNYFAGSVATYDANRIVKCGFYDEYNFYGGTHRTDLSGNVVTSWFASDKYRHWQMA